MRFWASDRVPEPECVLEISAAFGLRTRSERGERAFCKRDRTPFARPKPILRNVLKTNFLPIGPFV